MTGNRNVCTICHTSYIKPKVDGGYLQRKIYAFSACTDSSGVIDAWSDAWIYGKWNPVIKLYI